MKAAAPVAAKSDTPKPKVEKAEKTTADSQIKTESKPEPAAAPLAQPATPTQSIDPKIDQTTNIQSEDIDVRVDKTVAKEINELEELVRPFGSQAVSPTEPDQGPDLHVGVPVGADTPSATTPTPTPAAAPTPPTPTADQPLAQPAPQPIKKPTKKPTPAEQFVEFHTRATALRDQGAYAIAAMLYEEAAALAPTTNDARNTQFEELACYVKANDVKKAKALAAKLRQSSVLTRFERIKLDAVERMS